MTILNTLRSFVGGWLERSASRSTGMLALVTLALGLLSACGSPTIQPMRFNASPWRDGEVSTYRVTAVDATYAGTTRFDLLQLETGGWSLRRETSAQGVQEIATVEMSDRDYRPSSAILIRMDSGGIEQVRTTYAAGQVDLELTTKQNITTYERKSIPSDARDQRTLLMLLRALPLDQGYATRLNTYLPVVPILDRVTVSVLRRETVETPAGSFDTWVVRMDTGDSRTEAWIGTQAPYPLVKFVDGRNRGTYELLEFAPGP